MSRKKRLGPSDLSVAASRGCGFIRGGYIVTVGGKDVSVGRFTNRDESKVIFVGTIDGVGPRVILSQEEFDKLPSYKIC